MKVWEVQHSAKEHKQWRTPTWFIYLHAVPILWKPELIIAALILILLVLIILSYDFELVPWPRERNAMRLCSYNAQIGFTHCCLRDLNQAVYESSSLRLKMPMPDAPSFSHLHISSNRKTAILTSNIRRIAAW
jgi:hypothetical protein